MGTSIVESQQGAVDIAGPAPEYAGGVDIKDLIAILRRRKWVIISTALILTTLAVLIGLQITKKYTATTMVMIDPQQADVVNLQAVVQGLTTDSATVETQINVLQSQDLAAQVMDSLSLFNDPEFNQTLQENDNQLALKFGGPLQKLVAWMPDSWLIATGLADEPLPMATADQDPATQQNALEVFEKELKVAQQGRSYVIGVSFTSADAQKAAAIANRIAGLYIEGQKQLKLDTTMRASGYLADRLDSLKQDVQRSEAAVEAFRQKHSIVSSVNGIALKEQELSNVSNILLSAQADLAQKTARLRLMKDLRAKGAGALDSMGEVLSSEVIRDLRQQESVVVQQIGQARRDYGEKHPVMQALLAQKQDLERKVAIEVDRIIANVGNDVVASQASVDTIQAQLDKLTKENQQERDLDVQLRQLEREADANQQLYQTFLERFKETREQQGTIDADSRVISTAMPPTKPSTPGPVLFGAVGFTASMMLGTLLALLLERLDSGLRSARQVEQVLDLPALGLVPMLERMKRGQKPHQYLIAKPLSAYAESIRAIYTSLQLSDVDNPPKVVLVTSALPQEGKTTLALSLATFAARSAQRVLLIDLDLRHPSVQRELGSSPPHGFVEYMGGEKHLDEIIFHDEETGLDYLPVKRQTANPTDLLGSQKMRLLMEELRSRYDYVVIDSAPLLGVTDTKVASVLADKVVFASQWEKTSAETARNGLAHLHEARASVSGVVLTQVDVRKHAHYGYGDVGQYYGKYQKYYVN
jgi:exopolysaccharide transport family protein